MSGGRHHSSRCNLHDFVVKLFSVGRKNVKKRDKRTVVGETVSDVSELALLNVLLDRVERLFLGDFHLGVGPSGNLDNHCRLTQRQYLILEKKRKKKRDVLLRIVLDSSAKRGMSLMTPCQLAGLYWRSA